MKDSSSAFLVILVVLVTLIAGGTVYHLKNPRKLQLYDVDDRTYIHVMPDVDILLASDVEEEVLDFATSCHRID